MISFMVELNYFQKNVNIKLHHLQLQCKCKGISYDQVDKVCGLWFWFLLRADL